MRDPFSDTRLQSPARRHLMSSCIIAAGRADLCALARPHLADPAWTLHAAAAQGVTNVVWPKQYVGGKLQLERNLERAGQLAVSA